MSIYYYSYCEQCYTAIYQGKYEPYAELRHEIFKLYHHNSKNCSDHNVNFYNEYSWETKWNNICRALKISFHEPDVIQGGINFIIQIPSRIVNVFDVIDNYNYTDNTAMLRLVNDNKKYLLGKPYIDYKKEINKYAYELLQKECDCENALSDYYFTKKHICKYLGD